MPKKTGSGDYEIGYGKPPKHGQWQKGTSGNPSGKKKGKGLAHYLLEAGDEEKVFLVDGKEVVMPANAALAKKIYVFDAQKALSGDAPSQEVALTGPEEFEVAGGYAEWLKLIEDASGEVGEDGSDE